MQTVLSLVPYVVLVVGFVALVGGYRCVLDPDRAGLFIHPAAGIITVAFLAAMIAPLVMSFGGRVAGGQAAAFGNVLFLVLLMILYAPLLAYHAGQLLAGIFSPLSQPGPEPTDPLERAKAAEDRGDTRAAFERYMRLLDGEPSHVEARTRFAELLARTRNLERAKEVIGEGLARADVPPGARGEWRALELAIAEGKFGESPPEGAPAVLRALGDVPVPRLEAHRPEGPDGRPAAAQREGPDREGSAPYERPPPQSGEAEPAGDAPSAGRDDPPATEG